MRAQVNFEAQDFDEAEFDDVQADEGIIGKPIEEEGADG